jgi:protein-tyrosine phosphatase
MPAERPDKMWDRQPACGFFDIHCHILPQLDEGPLTVEESIKMLQLASDDGISGIVATPHIISGIYDNTKEIIERAIAELKVSANSVEIFTGAEIRIGRDLAARIDSRELPLINNNNFILLELPTYVIPPLRELEIIVRGLRNRQISPIFAHPERNVPIMKDLSIMEKLIKCGALFQMTAMSITDSAMQRSALNMIRKGYIHVVASDAHDARKRPPILSAAHKMISRKLGGEIAERLFTRNPLKIIRGEDIG